MNILKLARPREQQKLIYQAPAHVQLPQVPGAQLISFADGCVGQVTALYAPSRTGLYIVFFHGNADQLGGGPAQLAARVVPAGHGFLAVEYPGYATAARCAAGPPSEATIYAAASTALQHLFSPQPMGFGANPAMTVLVGESLGSAVALEMAARGFGGALVMLSAFTSIQDMGSLWVPRFIVKAFHGGQDRYDNLQKAPGVTVPTAIVHGAADDLVPVHMAQRLHQAMPQSQLVVLPCGHNDLLAGAPGNTTLQIILGMAQQLAARSGCMQAQGASAPGMMKVPMPQPPGPYLCS